MDEILNLNALLNGLMNRGNTVKVSRVGRGVLGRFISIRQANGSPKFDPDGNRITPKPEFWTITYDRPFPAPFQEFKAEMVTTRQYHELTVEKVDGEFHLIVPA